ncbi:ComF family protein [Microbacterium sp. GCS4]|uniref:ComF family protein n=1 Tax=Microbacterium sp. GCS4 TaxID=1692239 RepID=UPI00068052D1|nr:phosphoribosyltransferase family protein [Microbacterium sp. GCS4]KNY07415.1 hypothetical protein AKH00_03820 [Microbacterium sp. GCS4]
MFRDPHLSASLRSLGTEVLGLLLAACCAGCGAPEVILCDACRGELSAAPIDLRTPGGLAVRAALPFDGVRARCVRRLKDDGETLLVRPLGAALAAAIARSPVPSAALVPVPSAALVPVPTSRRSMRRRGFSVPEVLIRGTGHRPLRVLSTVPGRRDQRGLDVADRAANVRGSMRARSGSDGREVIVVDDVMTTGATLDEAATTLARAGYRVSSAVVLAATPRHSEP